jgi:transposase
MSIVILGVDLGKNSCSIVGVDGSGAVVVRRTMRRQTLIEYVGKLPQCVVAMEACCGAHHLGRLFATHGHEIRLMSPEYVRPYVKAQKNDDRDAEAIAEAASRPTMRFVDLKSSEQLDLQTLHRVRSRLVAERTSLINQARAILLERGVTFPAGRRKFEVGLEVLLADDADAGLSARMRQLIGELRAEWKALDVRVEALNGEFVETARQDETMRRLTSIPGVGVLNATALVAAVGNGSGFDKARDRSLAGPCPPPKQYRWQDSPVRYHQAGKQIPAHLADPRRAGSFAIIVTKRHADRALAQSDDRARRTPQCDHRRARQQAGADCLGDAAQGRAL